MKSAGFETFVDIIEQLLCVGFGPWRQFFGLLTEGAPCFFEHLPEEVCEPLL